MVDFVDFRAFFLNFFSLPDLSYRWCTCTWVNYLCDNNDDIDKIKVYLACVKMLKEVMELRGAESRA